MDNNSAGSGFWSQRRCLYSCIMKVMSRWSAGTTRLANSAASDCSYLLGISRLAQLLVSVTWLEPVCHTYSLLILLRPASTSQNSCQTSLQLSVMVFNEQAVSCKYVLEINKLCTCKPVLLQDSSDRQQYGTPTPQQEYADIN